MGIWDRDMLIWRGFGGKWRFEGVVGEGGMRWRLGRGVLGRGGLRWRLGRGVLGRGGLGRCRGEEPGRFLWEYHA